MWSILEGPRPRPRPQLPQQPMFELIRSEKDGWTGTGTGRGGENVLGFLLVLAG